MKDSLGERHGTVCDDLIW